MEYDYKHFKTHNIMDLKKYDDIICFDDEYVDMYCFEMPIINGVKYFCDEYRNNIDYDIEKIRFDVFLTIHDDDIINNYIFVTINDDYLIGVMLTDCADYTNHIECKFDTHFDIDLLYKLMIEKWGDENG